MLDKTTIKANLYKAKEVMQRSLNQLESDKAILQENKDTINAFVNSRLASGINEHRITVYVRLFKAIAQTINKPFKDMTRQDIESIFKKLYQESYKHNTILTY